MSPQYYTFNFKWINSKQNRVYFVNANLTMCQFIDDIKMRVRSDFELKNDEDIEIVIAGQYDNINGRDPEVAPAIQPSGILISELYENKKISFYIRKISNSLHLDMPQIGDIENNISMHMYVPRQYVGYENV